MTAHEIAWKLVRPSGKFGMKELVVCALLLTTTSCSPEGCKVVLINVGNSSRGQIANQIEVINAMNPGVISIDFRFMDSFGDSGDLRLYNALAKCKKLVMTTTIEDSVASMRWIVQGNHPNIKPPNAVTGFVSLNVDDISQSVREVMVTCCNNNHQKQELNFALQTVMQYNSLKASRFLKREPNIYQIEYAYWEGLRRFTAEDVVAGHLRKEDIEGKIVMIGFLGPGDEDKFISGTTSERPGVRDIYGLEIWATLVCQILDRGD